MRETPDEREIWRKFVKAENLHKGHDEEGRGSPITEIAWKFHRDQYRQIWNNKRPAKEGEKAHAE